MSTLNVNGLNSLIKRHRLAEQIKTHNPITYCLQDTHFRSKDTSRLNVKGWKICSMQIVTKNEQG